MNAIAGGEFIILPLCSTVLSQQIGAVFLTQN